MNTGRAVFFDRFSRLSNVSAALLNIAMFNTYQENADLRSAAYSLLSAVCSSLSYDVESFMPSSGMYRSHSFMFGFLTAFDQAGSYPVVRSRI